MKQADSLGPTKSFRRDSASADDTVRQPADGKVGGLPEPACWWGWVAELFKSLNKMCWGLLHDKGMGNGRMKDVGLVSPYPGM